jgi:hypothetical protein
MSETDSSGETFAEVVNALIVKITSARLLKALGIAFLALVVVGLSAPRMESTRLLMLVMAFAFLLVALVSFCALQRSLPANREKLWIIAVGAILFCGFCFFAMPSPATAHPLFNTPLSGKSDARAAVQVDILDSTWYGTVYNSTYQLYLSVQSTRFRGTDTRVLFPINVESFQGCNSRFVQLPFEVADDDVLIFQLVYQSGFTDEEQKWVLDASKSLGYCLVYAGEIRWPDHRSLSEAAFLSTADAAGRGLNVFFQQKFTNLAGADWIVESSRPYAPNRANKVTLIESNGNRARAHVRLYYPRLPLD